MSTKEKEVVVTTVRIEKSELEKFDKIIKEKGVYCRLQALRYLVSFYLYHRDNTFIKRDTFQEKNITTLVSVVIDREMLDNFNRAIKEDGAKTTTGAIRSMVSIFLNNPELFELGRPLQT